MVHWQLPFLSEKEKFHLELLMEMMTSPGQVSTNRAGQDFLFYFCGPRIPAQVYDYLRTQKSLGYTVYNHFYNYEQQGGAYFYILTQVDKFSMTEVYKEVTTFVGQFEQRSGSKKCSEIN